MQYEKIPRNSHNNKNYLAINSVDSNHHRIITLGSMVFLKSYQFDDHCEKLLNNPLIWKIKE